MIKVNKEELNKIKDLFMGIQDSMVIACLQGYMGDAYVDKLPDPDVGLIVSGEYSFFAGDPTNDAGKWLAHNVFNLIPGDETVCIFPDHEPKWYETLLSVKANSPEAVPRYGIVQKDYIFDEKKLHEYKEALPKGYVIKLFDEELYNQALSEDWSREFCETFESADDFMSRGFGYGALYNGKLVAGASTMTVYDGGAETQVATAPDFRRKGLALACSAAYLLEAQKRGIRACWDAANEISKKMALALGYEYKGIYMTVAMKRGDISIKHINDVCHREEALLLAWNVFKEFEAPEYSQDGIDEFYRCLHDEEFLPSLNIYGAYKKDVLVGIMAMRNNGTHISLFFVDSSCHRRGLGRQLFDVAAINCPGKKMTVNSSPYAVPIYHSLGFTDTDGEQIVNGIRFTPMECEL